MLAINTPNSTMQTIRDNFKAKRLSLNLTQEGLSSRSGVSLGSLKRFESTGQISLESLLKIAFILDSLDDFLDIAKVKDDEPQTMQELLRPKKERQRGALK
ncbi:MAG: helix-turn-helix transcriptional regulator [Sulfuricurvum sp.]|jgi:transcriptional regulator with XRE-family HTH domain